MSHCRHLRTYYDERGERCRDCGIYVAVVRQRPRIKKEH